MILLTGGGGGWVAEVRERSLVAPKSRLLYPLPSAPHIRDIAAMHDPSRDVSDDQIAGHQRTSCDCRPCGASSASARCAAASSARRSAIATEYLNQTTSAARHIKASKFV